MADLTPPASQNNTPMRPLGPADEIDHPASPTPATASSLPRSTLKSSTAPTGSALVIGTPEHDMDIDAELETHGQPPGYDKTADVGEAPPEYDIASDDEYSHSDISGDELIHEPLLSDEESDEGMEAEEERHEEEGEAAPEFEVDAEGPIAASSSDEKGKGKLDVEEAGQQQTRPQRGTRSSRIRAGRQAPDVKEAKGTRNPKTKLNRRGNDDRMRARPGQAQGGPLEGGKKDELLEQDTVRGWNRSFGDPFYSKELEAQVMRQLGREPGSAKQ